MQSQDFRLRSFEEYLPKRCSFILPTKGRGKLLEKTLKMCQKLITPADELIVIEGGATKETQKVIKKYSDIIDVYISEPDKVVAHAFNKGILMAKGRYIKNLADDDIIFPEAMEKAIRILDRNSQIDILVCGGTKIYPHGKVIFNIPENANYGHKPEDVIKYGACGIGFIIRKRTFAISGLIPLVTAADPAFIIQGILKGAHIKFCSINLFEHYLHKHSYIISRKIEINKDLLNLAFRYCSKYTYLRVRIMYFEKSLRLYYYVICHSIFSRSKLLQKIIFPYIKVKHFIVNTFYNNQRKKTKWNEKFSL